MNVNDEVKIEAEDINNELIGSKGKIVDVAPNGVPFDYYIKVRRRSNPNEFYPEEFCVREKEISQIK